MFVRGRSSEYNVRTGCCHSECSYGVYPKSNISKCSYGGNPKSRRRMFVRCPPGPRTNILRREWECSYVGDVHPVRTFHYTGGNVRTGARRNTHRSYGSPPYEHFTSGTVIPRHFPRTRENPERSALRIFARASTPYEHPQHASKCSHGVPYDHSLLP